MTLMQKGNRQLRVEDSEAGALAAKGYYKVEAEKEPPEKPSAEDSSDKDGELAGKESSAEDPPKSAKPKPEKEENK